MKSSINNSGKTGWSEVDSEFFAEATKATPNDFLLIKFAPHDWLFPKCSIIVHHGNHDNNECNIGY